MNLKLYWCFTGNGERDYWVVADSARKARSYFAEENDFEGWRVDSQCILRTLSFDNPWDPMRTNPFAPTREELEKWGVIYNSRFHVFSLGDKIFRPEGLLRALMISKAQAALRLRMRGHEKKTTISR